MHRLKLSDRLVQGIIVCVLIIGFMILLPHNQTSAVPVRELMSDSYVAQQTYNKVAPRIKTETKTVHKLSKEVLKIIHKQSKHKTGAVKDHAKNLIRTGKPS